MQPAVTSAAQDAVRQQFGQHDDSKAVIATDETGTVLFWSSGAEALYGWTEAEAVGRNIIDVTPATLSRRTAERIMHELIAGHSWSGDFTVHHRDGTAFTVHVQDEPVMLDGVVVGIVGVSTKR